MDMTEKKAFKKSLFGGFSKDDVNKYIAASVERYTAQIKELEDKLMAVQSERDELSKKLSDANSEISVLGEKKQELESLTLKYSELDSSFKATAEKLSERDGALSDANSEISALEKRVSELSEIEREYNARRTELADIEISARARAAEIINEAEEEAEKRNTELENEINCRKMAFEMKRNIMFSETNGVVDGIARLVDSLKNEVETMESRIVRITDSARNGISSLSNAVEDANTKLSDIKDRFNETEETVEE